MATGWMTLGRALFLACSWTWCIGMFLPVLLIEDFGVWGWVAFAAPNVVGAAAVGLLGSAKRSKRVVDRHIGAMRLFSAVTIAFHLYFLGRIPAFIGAPVPGVGVFGASAALLAIAVAAAWGLSHLKSRGWLFAAVGVFGLSILAALLMERMSGGRALGPPPETGTYPIRDLLWMAPALALGFLLCPHLDMTLHRVRRETPGRAGDAAFLLGFCVFFLGLITLSLLYAQGFIPGGWLNYWIGLHFFAQSVFTMGAHWRELRNQRDLRSRRPLGPIPLILAGGLAMGLFWRPDEFRLGYDLILFTFAVPLPGYVWIVMIPRRPSRSRPTTTWLTATLIASPIFAVGYFGHIWPLVAVAVGAMLVAPIVASRLGRRA